MLLDHFRPPLSDRRDWHGFHTQWAGVLSADLNRRLPDDWWAQPEVVFGIEIDVGVVEGAEAKPHTHNDFASLDDWTLPPPSLTVGCSLDADTVEIQVLNTGYGPSLMAAIELVSPSNKDRPASRQAFVSKCLAILAQGAGLIIVDVVTSRHADLHSELLHELHAVTDRPDFSLSASAFQVTRSADDTTEIKVWESALELDQPLPILPLFLRVGPMLPIHLQRTYVETCRQLRIPTTAVV
jgi:hypothetical protein